MSRRRSNNLQVPQANAALQQLKYEAAQELGITIPQDGYFGNVVSRETGSLGGYITKSWSNKQNNPCRAAAVCSNTHKHSILEAVL